MRFRLSITEPRSRNPSFNGEAPYRWATAAFVRKNSILASFKGRFSSLIVLVYYYYIQASRLELGTYISVVLLKKNKTVKIARSLVALNGKKAGFGERVEEVSAEMSSDASGYRSRCLFPWPTSVRGDATGKIGSSLTASTLLATRPVDASKVKPRMQMAMFRRSRKTRVEVGLEVVGDGLMLRHLDGLSFMYRLGSSNMGSSFIGDVLRQLHLIKTSADSPTSSPSASAHETISSVDSDGPSIADMNALACVAGLDICLLFVICVAFYYSAWLLHRGLCDSMADAEDDHLRLYFLGDEANVLKVAKKMATGVQANVSGGYFQHDKLVEVLQLDEHAAFEIVLVVVFIVVVDFNGDLSTVEIHKLSFSQGKPRDLFASHGAGGGEKRCYTMNAPSSIDVLFNWKTVLSLVKLYLKMSFYFVILLSENHLFHLISKKHQVELWYFLVVIAAPNACTIVKTNISICGSLFARDLPSEAKPYFANSPRRGDCGGDMTPLGVWIPRSALESLFLSELLGTLDRAQDRNTCQGVQDSMGIIHGAKNAPGYTFSLDFVQKKTTVLMMMTWRCHFSRTWFF
ncbi:hypothetical protein KCU81_g748, partial [Aureobasidium melanogenum]